MGKSQIHNNFNMEYLSKKWWIYVQFMAAK